jgi:hypothetical protein
MSSDPIGGGTRVPTRGDPTATERPRLSHHVWRDQLPDPARRLMTRKMPRCTPLWSSVVVDMEGELRLQTWTPFKARLVLHAGESISWTPVITLERGEVSGFELLAFGSWFEHSGLSPINEVSSVDAFHSALGRLAAETVLWLPQALTPQLGATWHPVDDHSASVSLPVFGHAVDVRVTVDRAGALVAVELDRWGSPDGGPPAMHRFGIAVDDDLETAEGVCVAGAGSMGWWWGTERWDEGEFLRFRVLDVHHPAPADP